MTEKIFDLAARFEDNRPHLRAVALRMLASPTEADDALQDAWLKMSRADHEPIDNVRGWMTTIVARVCLDVLRAKKGRREEPIEVEASPPPHMIDDVELADSVGAALTVVLDTLAPAERLAFVLHDLFDLPFEEIAPIVGRSAVAARQLASRARTRIRGGEPHAVDHERRREIIDAFVAASRGGDMSALVVLLDPDVVIRADQAAQAIGAYPDTRGADAVAKQFFGRAKGAERVVLDGLPGLMWAPGGKPRVVFDFTIVDDRIVAIDLIADPTTLADITFERP